MLVLIGVAKLDFEGDKSSWLLAAAQTCVLRELVGLDQVVNGGNARMKLWAALIRECEEPRLKVYLGLDYDASIEDIRFN